MAGIALAASGCAVNPPADSAIPPHQDGTTGTCDSTSIQQFVGREVTADVRTQMKQVSGAVIVRIVPPGVAITMEYSSQRLTVFTDASNRVERISCS
jgi:hypothetical protein